MALTNTSTLDDLLPSIVAEALFVASERSVMRNLVRNYQLAPGNGVTVKVPVYPQYNASVLTEATAPTANAITTSSATLTVREVGLMATVSDLSLMGSASNVTADIGRLFGEAIARRIDLDLTAQFANFTTNLLGNATAASATITVPDVFKAVAKLTALGVPGGDLVLVLHPRVAYDLKAALTNSFANPNAGIIQNGTMATGYIGQLAGCSVYETSNMASQTGSDDFTGGLFHRDALGLAMMQDIKIETQRQAGVRGYDIVGSSIYGVGVLYEANGVALGFDSTI